MIDFLLEPNLSEPTFAQAIAMNGVPASVLTLATSTHVDFWWRWHDEPTSQPHYLGTVAAGREFDIPFPFPFGRTLEIRVVSKTKEGVPDYRNIDQAPYFLFTIGLPILASLTYSAPTVTGVIQNQGGTGDIHILRRVTGTLEWTVIDTVSSSTTSFTDTPDAGQTYDYELTQDGFDGESSIVQIFIPAGSDAPPTLTSATFSTPNVNLVFARNGTATGDIRILRKGTMGDYAEIDHVADTATSYSDTSITVDDTYTYKLSQDGISGFSAEHSAVVTGISGGSGSPPSDLSADTSVINDDEVDVTLSWTNHGATGSVLVQRRQGTAGFFVTVDTLSSGSTSDIIAETRSSSNYTVQYKISNSSVPGETNIVTVTILRQF